MNPRRIGGRALLTLACIACPVVSNWASRHAPSRLLAVYLAWGPITLLGAWLIWRSPARRALGALAALALALLWRERSLVAAHFEWAYLAEHAGSLSLLGVMFASTLRAGRVPLVTRFASMVHTSMSASVLRYTRGATIAWTLFFAAMVVSSITLFVLAPLSVWALFASVGTPLLVGAMFVGEYLVRRRLLPREAHSGPYGAIRAYFLYTAGKPPAAAALPHGLGTLPPPLGSPE